MYEPVLVPEGKEQCPQFTNNIDENQHGRYARSLRYNLAST